MTGLRATLLRTGPAGTAVAARPGRSR